MNNSTISLFDLLDEAYKNNDVKELNRINALIMEDLGCAVSESTLDYELIENIREKAVGKNLRKMIKEDSLDKLEVLKTLSSLITHAIIESKVTNRELSQYPVKILTDLINKIVLDEGMIQDAKKFLCDKYGRFI